MQQDGTTRRTSLNETIGCYFGYWFGTRGSEVRILSPRPFSPTDKTLFVLSSVRASVSAGRAVPVTTVERKQRQSGKRAERSTNLIESAAAKC
jgi:hypothetical protein